ncbi:AAA family ATPase [Leucobacter sp. Psy1]|uniref:AAA family ATPase n=1 Tax=Leucobacter sp. Psy1 TaxID=2875729 RepID=UPI001CD35047|nr:AAA family ATPase [Leucobacter sp. Psy1]
MLLKIWSDAAFRGLSTMPFRSDSCVLGAQTIIYGRNGSGKTTFSEALRLSSLLGDANGVTFRARAFVDGALWNGAFSSEEFPLKVFVYNRYYVHDALRLFLDGEGSALPILKLGVENVQAEAGIQRALDHLDLLQRRRASVRTASDSISVERETLEREVKASVISALAEANSSYYNQTRYQVTQARKLLNDSDLVELTDAELKAETEVASASLREPVRISISPEPLEPEFHETLNSQLLGTTIESVPDSRLMGKAELAKWVEEGMTLHFEGDLCGFCREGTVSRETLLSYRAHFSDALDELRNSCLAAINFLDERRGSWERWLSDLPAVADYLPDFKDLASEQHSLVQEAVQVHVAALGRATDLIRERLADPLRPLPPSEQIAVQLPSVDLSAFQELVNKNNSAVGSQSGRIQAARTAVESHFGAASGVEYRRLQSRLEGGKRAILAIEKLECKISDKLTELRESQQDVGRMARLIDDDLRQYFGHAHLRVSVSSDGKGYVVNRGDQVAQRLSEGERNAIAFTYFLRSLEEDGNEPERSIVVVDDPMTSLDKEGLFATFSLMQKRTATFAQLVVLTHDYEYFRLNLLGLQNRWFQSQKKIREGDVAEAQRPRVAILEMIASSADNIGGREGLLRELPRGLVQHASEYHYLFRHVLEAIVDADASLSEYLPLLGNAGRRLLEGFLSFRAPSKIKFQEKVDEVVKKSSIGSDLAERVVKFLHSQSHREEPRPSGALDFPSIREELTTALVFMYLADREHFLAMVKAVGMDPQAVESLLDTGAL